MGGRKLAAMEQAAREATIQAVGKRAAALSSSGVFRNFSPISYFRRACANRLFLTTVYESTSIYMYLSHLALHCVGQVTRDNDTLDLRRPLIDLCKTRKHCI